MRIPDLRSIQQTSVRQQQTGSRQRDMPLLARHRSDAPHAYRAGPTRVVS